MLRLIIMNHDSVCLRSALVANPRCRGMEVASIPHLPRYAYAGESGNCACHTASWLHILHQETELVVQSHVDESDEDDMEL